MSINTPKTLEDRKLEDKLGPWFRLDSDSVNPEDHHRFVGLVVSQDGKSKPILRLPLGYPIPKNADELAKASNLIHQVWRVFIEGEKKLKLENSRHEVPKPAAIVKGYISIGLSADSDNKGEKLTETPDDDPYGLIASQRAEAFDELVLRMRQPEVLMTEVRQAWREGFDARHLHRMWPRALYCDDVPVFDTHLGRRHEMRESESHGILGLAAWLVVDYLKIMEPGRDLSSLGSAASMVQMLAQEFAGEQGLAIEATLWTWDKASQEKLSVRSMLNMAFADLLKRNPQRTPQAQELTELIDRALNTYTDLNNGELWGLKKFSDVWEAMCLAWVLKPDGAEFQQTSIFTIDDGHLHFSLPETQKTGWSKNRKTVFYSNNKNRRPDLVISFENNNNKFEKIIDFKYYSETDIKITFCCEREMLSDKIKNAHNHLFFPPPESKIVDLADAMKRSKEWDQLLWVKEVISSLEDYRLLAVINNLNDDVITRQTSNSHDAKRSESVPIEIWAPGDHDCAGERAKVLPHLTIRKIPIKELMKNYIQMTNAAQHL